MKCIVEYKILLLEVDTDHFNTLPKVNAFLNGTINWKNISVIQSLTEQKILN